MTRVPAALALCLAGCLAAAGARAQAAHEVAPLVVTPGPGPAVTATYPAAGASVPGGVVILKVVFDQPMTAEAWAYGRSADGDFPHCLAHPRLLADQRTFVLLCTVASSKAYAVEINPAPRFADLGGRSARPYVLKFSTTADGVSGLHDALTQAGLTDTDDPIMTWSDPGQGVSQTEEPR